MRNLGPDGVQDSPPSARPSSLHVHRSMTFCATMLFPWRIDTDRLPQLCFYIVLPCHYSGHPSIKPENSTMQLYFTDSGP